MFLVQAVGQLAVRDLFGDLEHPSDPGGRADLFYERRWDVVPVDVDGEAAQHRRVVGQVLQQNRGRLDEVAFGGHAGVPGPVVLPAQDRVEQVAELVEQDHDVFED